MEHLILQRIKYIIEGNHLTESSFAKAIGSNQRTINQQLKGERSLSLDTVNKIISSFIGISPGWLLTGEGEMLKPDIARATPNTDGIPLYKIEAAAGFGNSNFSIDENDIEARYKIKELETSSFMLHIRGDSMTPTYNNGDVIAVQVVTDQRKIQWGKPHLISSASDGLLVKRIYDDEEGIVAVSDNPTYKPIHIGKEEIAGIAIVKGCVKFEN